MSEQIEKAEEELNISLLVEIIGSNMDDEDVLDEALSAAYRLCVSLPTTSLESVDTAVFSQTMSNCLEKCWEEPSLLEMIFGCIRCFASKNAEMQTELCTDNNLKLLVQALNTHTDGEETVQEQGCLVVEAFARESPANIARIMTPEYKINEVLDRAKELITNERNKKYPMQAREALGL